MKIKIYSTPACPYCKMVKKYLKEKELEFDDIDISKNQEAAHEMVEKSGQMSVPVIDIDGKIIIGFDREKLEKLIKK
ncbi:NrdH-redoxin [Candidatus Pacearchaeota archaeon]|nr:NrdH-redoxin [Candidatus Pacearchaeota archaeon]MBD3283485.1 NrdH-redoxin [Candidatus Pacearchaeota archaeon]